MDIPTIIGPATLYLGDCIEVLRGLPDSSVDSVVTDPPYGIRFMGKSWDGADIEARTERRRSFASHAPDAGPNGGHKSIAAEAGKYDLAPAAMRAFQEFSEEWAREALRVLKPGGHLLSFSSARTYHRMVSGIEDAGFEIRDQIMWIFGSGFPKAEIWTDAKAGSGGAESVKMVEAGFEGWARGGLKPAHEPICVARKPFPGNVASNVLLHGTGAINIDACRIETDDKLAVGAGATWDAFHKHEGRSGQPSAGKRYGAGGDDGFAMLPGARQHALGRFPANVIHDGSDEVLAAFPDAAGQQGALTGAEPSPRTRAGLCFGAMDRGHTSTPRIEIDKSAARFFYCAKASRADRDAGLESFDECVVDVLAGHRSRRMKEVKRPDGAEPALGRNIHPTVKPTELMAYLCRLVTPPGGVVLDLFMGSGSTGKACIREGFQFIGIELSPEYMPIAHARIEFEIDAVAQRAAEERQRAAVVAERHRIESLQTTIFKLDGI